MQENIKLSEKEKMILDFMKKQIDENGYPPSVREICKAVGLSSTSTVHGYLEKLHKKGAIQKVDNKTRALKVLIGGDKPKEKQVYAGKEMIDVPVIGKITAGAPILAVENITDTFPIPIAQPALINIKPNLLFKLSLCILFLLNY